MYDLTALRERLRTQRPVPWDQLPDFSLYMDQVLSYMDRQVIRFDEDDGLTAAMVNNYIKDGLLPRAEGKRYSRVHLAYLTAICVLKRVMSTRDMDLLIREELQGDRPISDGYAAFCGSLNKALNAVADEMEDRTGEEELADAAIHFALMSYAAGVASSRYVTLLRQRQEEELRAGQSLCGIHREDLELLLDDQPARVYASQGQQRSVVLSLKMAEATAAAQITGEHPVLLLDDVLSELDEGRKQYLLTCMKEKQTFVTSCDDTAFLKTDGEVYRMNGGVLSKA